MNGGYARRKYFRHITAGCTNFTAPICMDVRMLIVYSLPLAAATRGDVPSDMMYGRSSRRHSACMHRLPSVPRTQSMYARQRCSAAPLYPTLLIYDFLVLKSKL